MEKMNFNCNSISSKYLISWNYNEAKFYINVTIPNKAKTEIILSNGACKNITKEGYHY